MKNILKLIFILALLFNCKDNKQTTSAKKESKSENYILPQKRYGFKIEKTDSSTFFQNYIKNSFNSIPKIENIDEIKKITKGKLVIKNYNEAENDGIGGYFAEKIILSNGKEILLNKYSECGIICYYPKEKIIVSECGHTSDQAYNIETGDSTEIVGNPEYISYSPSKKFRLNGYFEGQDCINYFFENNIGNKYQKIFNYNYTNGGFCYFEKFYWKDDFTFYFKIKNYTTDSEKGKNEYYLLRIVEGVKN